jgi:glutamate-1-semialdehyde 2,1-aminomutase
LTLGVEPDIAVFAKAMANGYAMAAVIGCEDVMEASQKSFISSTNWTESIGPTAALATIRKHRSKNVGAYIQDIGKKVKACWSINAENAGLPLHVSGLDSLAHFAIEHPDAIALTTLFIRSMLDRGFLAFNQFKPSYAHNDQHIKEYSDALEEVFVILTETIESGDVLDRIDNMPARTGFYRLTS